MPRPGDRPAGSGAGARNGADGADGADKDSSSLPVDATVDLGSLGMELGISRTLDDLDEQLVGLAPVKRRLREIGALLMIDRLRVRFGLHSPRPNLHMCFAGSPGTGKTTVATKMAEILCALGYLPSDHLVTVGREDLVGQYVGHTGPKTKDVVKRAMGGVLFIDEAYSLHRPDNERDYGQEAIEILLQVMEEHRDRLVVILAGYSDRMDGFFGLNPGLRSRIAHHLDFPEFSVVELVEIGHRMLVEQGYELAPDAESVFSEYVTRRRGQAHFANARSIRNAIDRSRLRQAARLVDAGGLVTRDSLRTITSADLLASGVFTDVPESSGVAEREDPPEALDSPEQTDPSGPPR
ncbi:MAG: AAA family ATPase [Acidimicrobiales bacterium]